MRQCRRRGEQDQRRSRYPDKSGVRDILAHYFGADIAIDDSILHGLLGLSGADLANIVREARGRARRAGVPLKVHLLRDAVAAAMPTAPAEKLYRIAAHEAGHIVTAAALGLPLPVRARVTPTGGEVMRPAASVYTPETIKLELAYLMGGRAAEKLLLGDISSGSGASTDSDLNQATDIVIAQEQEWGIGQSGLFFAPIHPAQRHTLSESRRHVINERLKRAEELAVKTLSENLELLKCVTGAMLKERELNDLQISSLVARRMKTHQISGLG